MVNEVLADIIGTGSPVVRTLSVWGTTGTIAGVLKRLSYEQHVQ
ncbi:MAG: hypothetical protein WDO15_08610 [Bacteroidota bacterium]